MWHSPSQDARCTREEFVIVAGYAGGHEDFGNEEDAGAGKSALAR
jgi:hypothetical protein